MPIRLYNFVRIISRVSCLLCCDEAVRKCQKSFCLSLYKIFVIAGNTIVIYVKNILFSDLQNSKLY